MIPTDISDKHLKSKLSLIMNIITCIKLLLVAHIANEAIDYA